MKHPNILPFYGVSHRGTHPCLVSPWMENGNIRNFVTKNPHINRFKLVGPPYPPLEQCLILLSWSTYARLFSTCTRKTLSTVISKGYVSPFLSYRRCVQSIRFRITCLLMSTTGPACRTSVWRVSTAPVSSVSHPTRVTQEESPLTWLRNSSIVRTRAVNQRYP